MEFIHLIWKINDEKIKKSKRERKNNLLERKIERNEINERNETNFYNKFTENNQFIEEGNQSNMNLINFRDSIELNVESRNNNREILEKRLNNRDKMGNCRVNPYLSSNKYLEDISNEDKYLRPKNTNEINKDETQ
tara:strand:+ start:1570 stop:1977 length:408 start_codon:yes stop_codon:yes gene_type:complete